MDLKSLNFSLKTIFYFVFLLSSQAQGQICNTTAEQTTIQENNTVGAIVFLITMDAGVILTLTQNPQEAFGLSGGEVIVNKVLDYEAGNNVLVPHIQCSKLNPDGEVQIHFLTLLVSVVNINDNPPVFAESQYTLPVSELSKVNTSVASIIATDLDGDRLYYRLDPDTEGFKLQTDTNPNIVMQRLIDYDTVQRVTLTLYVQDTPPAPAPAVIPSHTVSTTITVNIVDIDNRPPWFQPCTVMPIGTAKICLNSGYQGKVNLTEQEVAPLTLQPGPVYAMDGDKGINERINYRLVGGNEAGIFQISENTGNITMLKPVDVAGPIILNVLASQVSNIDQFATTTVIFEVVSKSVHPPKFEKSSYEGYISIDSGLDSLVLESESSNRPLRVQAKDEDFGDGINHDVQYEVQDSSDFTITPQGFILMTKEISPGTISLQLRAVDTTNGETGTAALSVQVRPGTVTTTTDMAPTSSSTDMTSNATKVTDMTSDTTKVTDSITNSSLSPTADSITSSPSSTSGPHTEGLPLGGYRVEDMAALGASLAIMLILCLVAIGLLVFRIRKGSTDWKKLAEASIFRSSLGGGSAGPKEGVQYTNEGSQNDGDAGSVGSTHADEMNLKRDAEPNRKSREKALEEAVSAYITILPDAASLADSDKADSEKEVKPILTKERRVEEGYKSVWFKEDIDPNAKEDVVIIPDNGERDDDDDDESVGGEERETDEDNELAGRYTVSANHGASDSEDEDGTASDL